jgi:hypothetical protein
MSKHTYYKGWRRILGRAGLSPQQTLSSAQGWRPKTASVGPRTVEKSSAWSFWTAKPATGPFQTHGAHFDGGTFVGVTSTGIYCGPICPARTPKLENCRFFASAAAREVGFRPCLRCRQSVRCRERRLSWRTQCPAR